MKNPRTPAPRKERDLALNIYAPPTAGRKSRRGNDKREHPPPRPPRETPTNRGSPLVSATGRETRTSAHDRNALDDGSNSEQDKRDGIERGGGEGRGRGAADSRKPEAGRDLNSQGAPLADGKRELCCCCCCSCAPALAVVGRNGKCGGEGEAGI
ncbi:hypothetical protein NL676_014276 [Syzygium grande]|nr:hypothetical protein NL676_014276 [Syzygium grande]